MEQKFVMIQFNSNGSFSFNSNAGQILALGAVEAVAALLKKSITDEHSLVKEAPVAQHADTVPADVIAEAQAEVAAQPQDQEATLTAPPVVPEVQAPAAL